MEGSTANYGPISQALNTVTLVPNLLITSVSTLYTPVVSGYKKKLAARVITLEPLKVIDGMNLLLYTYDVPSQQCVSREYAST